MDIAAGLSWNPFLTQHDLGFFNDHFAPGILSVVPLLWLTGFSPFTLLVWEWLWWFLALVVIFSWGKKHKSISWSLWACFFVLFTKGHLAGLNFPIHPDTWSIPFWLGLVWAIRFDKFKWVMMMALGASIFKESFPFAFVGLAAYYFLSRQWKRSLVMGAFALSYLILAFKIRPLIVGELYNYSGSAISGLFDDPYNYLKVRIVDFHYLVAFKLFYPFVIPLIFIIKKEVKNTKHFIVPVMMTWAPLMLLHFLTNKIYDQYAPALVSLPLGVVLFSSFLPEKNEERIDRVLIFSFLLFVISASSLYTKHLRFLVTSKTDKCIINSEKSSEFKEVKKLIKKLPIEKRLYSTGGAIPNIYRAGMKIYQFGGLHDEDDYIYDYVLIEKKGSGDIFPIPKENIDHLYHSCLNQGKTVLFDGKYFYLGEGKFTRHCDLEQW